MTDFFGRPRMIVVFPLAALCISGGVYPHIEARESSNTIDANGTPTGGCADFIFFDFSEPADPPVDTSRIVREVIVDFLEEARDQIIDFMNRNVIAPGRERARRNYEEKVRSGEIIIIDKPVGGGGLRGSIDVRGGDLFEASPAYISRSVSVGDANEAFLDLLLVVPSDGDWLGVWLDDRMICARPLSDFEPGLLYRAVLPVSDFAGLDAILTIHLFSRGEPNARVFLVDEILAVHLDEDLDGDGILDAADNCPNVPNPDQADSMTTVPATSASATATATGSSKTSTTASPR